MCSFFSANSKVPESSFCFRRLFGADSRVLSNDIFSLYVRYELTGFIKKPIYYIPSAFIIIAIINVFGAWAENHSSVACGSDVDAQAADSLSRSRIHRNIDQI